jgi:hypothetical protein
MKQRLTSRQLRGYVVELWVAGRDHGWPSA